MQLVNPARYRNFVAGANVVSDAALAIGAGATISAGSFKQPTKESTAEYIRRCETFREVHDVAPSAQISREWVKQLDKGNEPKVIRTASKLRQLEAENQALKADKKRLESEVADLRAELDRVRGKAVTAA